jgi:hypothetical protein
VSAVVSLRTCGAFFGELKRSVGLGFSDRVVDCMASLNIAGDSIFFSATSPPRYFCID